MAGLGVGVAKAAGGWYPDPEGSQRLRYWDGQTWTSEFSDPVASETDSVPPGAPSFPTFTAAGEASGPVGRFEVADEPSVIEASRQFDLSSLAGLVPVLALLPVTYLALGPLLFIADIFLPMPGWFLGFVLYVAAGVCLLLPQAQRLVLRLFGARDPVPEEAAVLVPAWNAVLGTANVPQDKYLLTVSDDSAPNAFAAGGSIVTVTRGALTVLPPNELRGVLAHELGHHLGLHSVGLLLGYWFGMPVLVLSNLGYALARVAYWFTAVFAAFAFPLATIIGLVIGTIFRVLAWALLALQRLAAAIARFIGQQSEYIADRAAVELGYGPELSSALSRFMHLGLEEPATSMSAQIFATHPPLATRINRIQAALDRLSG